MKTMDKVEGKNKYTKIDDALPAARHTTIKDFLSSPQQEDDFRHDVNLFWNVVNMSRKMLLSFSSVSLAAAFSASADFERLNRDGRLKGSQRREEL